MSRVRDGGWGEWAAFFDDIIFVLNLLRARFRLFRPLDLDQEHQLFSSRLLPNFNPLVFLLLFPDVPNCAIVAIVGDFRFLFFVHI